LHSFSAVVKPVGGQTYGRDSCDSHLPCLLEPICIYGVMSCRCSCFCVCCSRHICWSGIQQVWL